MKKNLPDCLFIHVPYLNLYKPDEYGSFVNIIAMGVFSMANELKKQGFNPEILHIGIEKALNKNFDIAEYIRENNIKFVALSLHWHFQVYDTLNIARYIKENSNTFIVMGGYTSSAFAKDILEQYEYVDAVIKGEGEKPIVELAKKIYINNNDLSDIPNLYWRNNNNIITNEQIWFANEEELNSYDFNGLKFLKNNDIYLRLGLYLNQDLKNPLPIKLKDEREIVCCLGRGCPNNCTWCGGGFNAVKMITGRDKITLRNSKIVAKEILAYKNFYNIDTFYFCYDSYPKKQDYIVNLFEILGKEMPNEINIKFECFGLPTYQFIDSLKKNLGDNSQIIISPDFGDDEYRKEHKKAFSYTNYELFDCLSIIDSKRINCMLYFTEIPNENLIQKKKTKWIIEKIKREYPNFTIGEISIDTYEPFSPWVLNPNKYGVNPNLITLNDYVKYSKGFRDYI